MEPEAQIARPFLHQEAEKTSEGADETLRTPVAIFQIRSWALPVVISRPPRTLRDMR
jgi:hypothetical protein